MTEVQPRRGISRRFLQQIETEIAVWLQRGTISKEQAEAISSQYVVVSPLYGRLIVVLVTLGAILAGVGIILLVSANWQHIPRAAKIILILVLNALVYTLGYWLKYERKYSRAGGAVIFVGAMVYGAALFLVGQQYHLPIDDPRLMTWWFIGVLPIAYLTRSRSVLVLSILAGTWGLGYKIFHWLDGIDHAEYAFFAFFLALGTAVYSIGVVHKHYQRTRLYAPIYKFFGLVLLLGVTFILSFSGVYSFNAFSAWDFSRLPVGFVVTFNITLGATIIGAAWCLAEDRRKKETAPKHWADLPAAILFAAASYIIINLPFATSAPYAIIFNILFFGGVIGLVFLGYFRGSGLLVNTGLVFFGVGVIGRYFDLAWKALPRSAFFIIGGIVLLGVGILLERLRRKTLQRMKAIEVSDAEET